MLDANPEKHKRNRDDVLADFEILAAGDIGDIIHLKTGKWKYYKECELGQELGLTASEIKTSD